SGHQRTVQLSGGDVGGDEAGGAALEAERALDLDDQLEVEIVAGVAGDDVADHRAPQQGQVADEVEDLVPHELITIAQPVEYAVLPEYDRVGHRSTTRQPVATELAEILQEAVRSRRREV